MASSRYFVFQVLFCLNTAPVVLLGLLSMPAFAKEPELSAIEVYPNGDAQAYVQIAGFVLNTKNEVHLCEGEQSINRNSYSKLPKIPLAAGMSLERAQNGVLFLTRGEGQPECVVPANLKDLEKGGGETPAELAEKTDLHGQILSKSISSTQTIPRLAPGVKIVLLAKLDTELAEFLLAQRSNNIAAWTSYLQKYPSGPHSGGAKSVLAVLYVQDGQAALTAYQASLKDPQPNYEKLRAAKSALRSAMALVPPNPGTADLAAGIHQQAQSLNGKAMGEIALYEEALAKQTSGYTHLDSAEAILKITSRLDPDSRETISLNKADTRERTTLDHRFVDFDNNLSKDHPDEAYEAIKPLRPFAQENSNVQDRLDRLYSYYVEAGKKDEAKSDPQDQVTEYKKAYQVEPRPEMVEMLKAAEQHAQESTDKAAVTTALNMSSGAEEDKDYVTAYEVLLNLTPTQQKQGQVPDQLAALKDTYLQKAPPVARDLQKNNTPPKGLPSEIGLQRAYSIMEHCFGLNSDPDFEDRVLLLGHSLSEYYLERAKYYLNRGNGSGAYLGWTYLDEASQYKVPDANALRDEIKVVANGHQPRPTASISIKFSDLNATPDERDFPARLTRSVAAALEASYPRMTVFGPNEAGAPAFAMVGEVRITKRPKIESVAKTSQFSSAEPVTNEDWTKANDELTRAQETWEAERDALRGAEAHGKKKAIEDERIRTNAAQQKVDAARAKLNSIPKNRVDATARPYGYTEQINHLGITVEMQFSIQDSTAKAMATPAPISVSKQQDIITLEGVKPGDTTVEPVGPGALTEAQFLDQVEAEANEALIKEARECVAGLPKLILQSADQKASAADNDGAAELYMLYLDSTEKQATPDWKRAQKFLFDNYNFRAYGDGPQA
jgi:hypothetical protein